MTSTETIPSNAVDQLIARQLPTWLTDTEPTLLKHYHQALRAQQEAAERLQHLLGRIPAIEAFAAPLLEHALSAAGFGQIDVRRSSVIVGEEFKLPSAAEKLYQPSMTLTTRQTLLSAALHNFEAHEEEPWILRKAHLAGPDGARLSMPFERFVRLCRELDVGGKYQALLKTVLQPKSGRGQPEQQARGAIAQLFEQGVRTRLQASIYGGRLRKQLDGFDLQRLQTLFEQPPQQAPGGGAFTPRQLYLLGKCIVGVIALEWRPAGSRDIDEVMLWIPGDPEREWHFHDSWAELYAKLALRLTMPLFREFFRRFINAQDRTQFDLALSRALVASTRKERVELDGRNRPVDGGVFAHVRGLLIAKVFEDAAHLAVPTDVEDRLSRHKRLQAMFSAGLDLLGLAGFVVPVLGELMLVVSAAQLLDEVYEGYQDWQLGDRQGALDHLFAVAQSVVLAGATAGALHGLKRIPFVDGLAPKVIGSEGLRLVRNPHYIPAEESPLVLLEGLPGDHFAGLLSTDAALLLEVSGFDPQQLRRLNLERAAPPARLLDMHERIQLYKASATLRGVAFEQALEDLHPTLSNDQMKLMQAFSGLTPRGAQEVIEQSSSSLLERLHSSNRVPLAMAERARWYVRDSRVDRACLGIRLQALGNADSERLVLALIEREAPWPSSVRVELRDGNRSGHLLQATAGEAPEQVRVIVRQEQGYRLAGEENQAPDSAGHSLLQAVLRCLDDDQKVKLGSASLQANQLRDRLLQMAAQDREQAARLIGQPPVGINIRPPRRFADGRLAYALSGGGESSRQAIRQGIHQIFPTLTEMQLDVYLDAVRQRGDNLWNHYLMLQRQLTELREALRLWQSNWQTPIDAIRRRRVADTIRRSWRRKLVDGNDQYELTLDGEPVAQLPALPAGVDFAHVRRLTLRNMQLQNLDAGFLGLFPNVVDLDLSGNRLGSVPEGIERMTQLRRVNLGNNQIALDEAGSQRLAKLTRLDTLILSYNPLNGMPDLSVLPHVRDIRLRSTGQVDISQVHQNVSLRAHVDLRDNRIRELRSELRGLRLRLQRLNLHENPLSESSALYLDEARGVSETGARGSASHVHRAVDKNIRDAWVETDDRLLRAERETAWQRLVDEPGSGGLFRFLADFVETEDFVANRSYFRRRVWRILEACESNEALREELFREADGPRSCDDRLLLMLNQMEVGILAHEGIVGGPVVMRENRLLRLGRQLHRLDLLDDIANDHVQRLRSEGRHRVDEIEVRLYYRSQLAGALDLPVVPDPMHFASYAHVSMADLSRAELHVLRADTPVAMLDALVERPYWQRYLRETYHERFEAMGAGFHERLEALEERATVGQEADYDERARLLMAQYAAEEAVLIRNLTTEAWARSRYASHERLLPA
ncbi:NEL-type E3 ubiquitin ligase domain-containing protein [Pseudomonas sp. NPDC089422]|uniref:NEL-type E3 ubiquitin ligase domain-containing protein n=1 Tax=Pseudomonas sp. NPDC089422 TaxID=3364466 RepID=UPI00382F35BD